MYGKCMSISDVLMLEYFDLLEAGEWPDLAPDRARLAKDDGDPLAFKHAFARRMVARFAGSEAADRAAEHFAKVITRKEIPDEVSEMEQAVGSDGLSGLLEMLEAADLVASRSEARRLVSQNAVQIDGERVADPTLRLAPGSYLIKVGKRRFVRIVLR
jgi:tyrosyl-tRNA synthetase